MNTVKIFLRTDHLNKDGSHTVCIRLIGNRRKKDISLRIYVKSKDWNFIRNIVNKSDQSSVRKNKWIQKYRNKAENIVDDYFFNDETLNFDDFEKVLFNKEYNDSSFIEFVFDEIPKKNFAKETNRTYISQITKLQRFKKNVHFSEINKGFIQRYQDYMERTLKNNQNTIGKSLSMLKTFVNWAIEQRLIKDNPFDLVKISKGKGKRESLSLSELEKLEALYRGNTLGSNYQNVLRYFLFSCYTGLRYTDVRDLKLNHIKKRLFNNTNTSFIELKMHKTQLEVSIPIIKKAFELIPPLININKNVFKVLTNQKTNEYLKKIISEAEIDKRITFHSARHSFATIGLDMGIPIEVVSKMLGHTEIKMTEIYAKVSDNLKYREMLKLDKKAS